MECRIATSVVTGVSSQAGTNVGARSTTTTLSTPAIPSPFWTDQTSAQISFGSATGLNGAPFVESSVTGMQVSDVMTTQTVADQVVAKFLGVVDGYSMTFTLWASNLVDCSNKYRLIPRSHHIKSTGHLDPRLRPTSFHVPALEWGRIPGSQRIPARRPGNDLLQQLGRKSANSSRLLSVHLSNVRVGRRGRCKPRGQSQDVRQPRSPRDHRGSQHGGLVAHELLWSGTVPRRTSAASSRSERRTGAPPLPDPGFITDLARKSGVLGACSDVPHCPEAFQMGTEVLEDALKFAGLRDLLRPSSTFLSVLAIRPRYPLQLFRRPMGKQCK